MTQPPTPPEVTTPPDLATTPQPTALPGQDGAPEQTGPPARTPSKPARHRVWREIRDWSSALLFAALLTQFGVTAVNVDGVSMMPALHNRELLIVPKIEGWAHRLGIGQYERGQIVVFKAPRDSAEWTNEYRGLHLPWRYRPYLVKRIVGVPGDLVQVQAGEVIVNGVPQPEPATTAFWTGSCRDITSDVANTPATRVPAGHYFVMGDNRSPGGSLDSRLFGPVPTADIAGRAVVSVWPIMTKDAQPPVCGSEREETPASSDSQPHFNPRVLPRSN